eukprot:ctg_226.g162
MTGAYGGRPASARASSVVARISVHILGRSRRRGRRSSRRRMKRYVGALVPALGRGCDVPAVYTSEAVSACP